MTMQLTTRELIAIHNTQDTRPLRDWRKSKAQLAARVATKGGVCRTVARLLVDTDLPYAAIVEHVKTLHPGASTSTRSVASIAADLRRFGMDLPKRPRSVAVH